jgi:serine/threonine protein kinase
VLSQTQLHCQIGDLGCAILDLPETRLVHNRASAVELKGMQLVKWPYRAPELTYGDWNYGNRIDIWAVGANCYEVANGRRLFNFPQEGDLREQWPACFEHEALRNAFGHLPCFSLTGTVAKRDILFGLRGHCRDMALQYETCPIRNM